MVKETKIERCLFYAMSAFIFIAPFIFIKGIYKYVTIPQTAFIQVFAVFTSVLFFFVCLISKKSIKISNHPLSIAVMCFLAWTLVSAFYAHNHFESLTAWSHLTSCVLVFFIFQQIRWTTKTAKLLLIVIYATGVITAIIGICQQFGLDIIPQAAPPAATFANRNMAAQFITLTFPLVVLICGKRLLSILCSTLMLTFLFFTGCMAAQISVCLEILLITFVFYSDGIINKAKAIYKYKTITCMLLTIMLIASVNISSSIYNLPTAQSRLEIWSGTIEMIKDNPILGVGIGNHEVFYPKYKRAGRFEHLMFNENIKVTDAHNDILQFIAETGMIGGLILSLAFILLFRIIVMLLYDKADDKSQVALAIGVSIVGILLNSCFSFPFNMPIPPFIVMIYMAIVFGLLDHNYKSLRLPNKAILILIILLIPTATMIVKYHYNNIKSDKYYLYTKLFEQKADWKSVNLLASRAYKLNPYNTKILAYSARAYIETGQYQKGAEALEKVIAAYPYNTNSLINLGVAYCQLGRYQDAVTCSNRVLDIQPDNKKALINMAVAYARLKEYDKAFIAYNKAGQGK